jgi:RNA polymerase sigma factor (sigma-70 family)
MWSKPGGRVLRLVEPTTETAAEALVADPLAPIAEAAVSGDRVAVRTFLTTIGPHLLRVVRRVLGPQHRDVDDVMQESALAVIDALPRRRGDSTVLHFVCRVAVLTAINARRRSSAKKRGSPRDELADLEHVAHPGAGPEAAASAQATVDAVRALLDTLPVEQAEVLTLHCVVGYTLPEIARATRAPLETVRSRLRLAKQALRLRMLGDPRLHNLVGDPS